MEELQTFKIVIIWISTILLMEQLRTTSFLQQISSTSNQLVCPLCPATLPHLPLRYDIKGYLKHIKLFHAHQSGFQLTCGIGGCKRSFTNFRTFQDHVSAAHKHQNQLVNITNIDTTAADVHNGDHGNHDQLVSLENPDSSNSDSSPSMLTDLMQTSCDENATPNPFEVLQKSSALFILGLKERHRLPQAVLQQILDGVTILSQSRLNVLQSEVMQVAKEEGMSSSSCDKLNSMFDENGHYGCPFKGLETQYQQMKYFKTHFHYIEPVQVLLGERRVWKGRGIKRRCVVKKDYAYYIPVLETLQVLLKNEAILAEVENGHTSHNVMQDFCDGSSFCSNPLYATKPNALQILLYYDELETCNPLSSKTSIHKLGNFYFTLGNMHPRYRSRLSAIQLVCIVKTSIIKMYGMDAVLKPIVEDIKELERGRAFVVHGESKVYFGSLALVSADNLGSLALGGFKESCTASRMCRHCMATKENFKELFLESDFELRNKESHLTHCALLDTDSSGDVSKEYGINRNSVLNELSYFDMCSGALIPDIMHDMLEGTLQYEVKLMLKVMIFTDEYFSLDYLNSRIANLELGHMESKDRPSLISLQSLQTSGCSLKQKAAQMWLFGCILPLLIGDKVPDDDDKWKLFLDLMEIMDYLFSPKITEDHAAYLSILISNHHQDFVMVYPDYNIIPKMHFMVHMPRLMIQFGPLVHHWTMRFEAKHAYFKKLAQSLGNFINLPYSLSTRHQQLHCYLYSNTKEMPGGNALEIGPGCVTAVPIQEENCNSAFKANWIKIGMTEYRPGDGIIIRVDDDKDLPDIGEILKLYVINNNICFEVRKFHSQYDPHFRLYTLDQSFADDACFVFHSELVMQAPVHIRSSLAFGNKKLFILPHAL